MFPESELFGAEEFFVKDDSPEDNTKIAFTAIYFSEEELKEFKKLCKEGMRAVYPADKLNEKANISDFILTLLRTNYGTKNSSAEIIH